MKWAPGICVFLALAPTLSADARLRIIAHRGYPGCIELSNVVACAVIEPNLGGRVISFSLQGSEVLYQDATFDGKTWANLPAEGEIPGGRFDVGPEFGLPGHPDLWLGAWHAEITTDNSARLTSRIDPATGLRIVRKFTLDPERALLTCRQTFTNCATIPRRVCHWSRTFVPGDGTCLIPLNPASRYPSGYATQAPGFVLQFRPPPDPAMLVGNHVLTITGTPGTTKIVVDANEGWLGYQTPGGVFLLKRFAVQPRGFYGEPAANSAALWFKRDLICELEAIGPLEELAPGQGASFTEQWWLFSAPGPIDTAALRARVAETTPMGDP